MGGSIIGKLPYETLKITEYTEKGAGLMFSSVLPCYSVFDFAIQHLFGHTLRERDR